MSVGESFGSHSLHSFAEFLQYHINSPEASSLLVQQEKAFEAFESFEAFQVKVYGFRSSSKEGGQTET